MKILIIGGASGDVGRNLTKILLRDKSKIEYITVTSRKKEVCNKFLDELDDKRVIALKLDVNDEKELLKAIRKHDLVINVIGPFSNYGITIMKASIKCKVNYIDICDDIEPTIEALQLDKFAKDAGIFLLLSIGWFPGMSNLRAKALADQMDEVEEIIIAWVAGKKSPEEIPSKGLAGVEHYMKALTGKIYSYVNGRRVRIPARQNGIKITFPDPLGPHMCYQIEHPESATLPYVIPNVKNVTVLGSLYPESRNKMVRIITKLIDLKLLSINISKKISGFFMRSKRKVNLPALNGAFISCIGKKDGKRGQLIYSEVNTKTSTVEATSQPLACAIFYHLYGGKIKPGVHLPEEVLKINDIIKIGKRHNLPFVTEVNNNIQWSEI